MKRDLDLIRDLLLAIEDGRADELVVPHDLDIDGRQRSPQEVQYHIRLLLDADYLTGFPTAGARPYLISGMTMKGHDYLDSIRDPQIWKKTKEGAEKAGGFTLSLLGDLAKGFIKTKIKEQTGVDL